MTDTWTPEEIDKLICLVQSNELIYNAELSGHSNRNTVDLIWNAISNKVSNKSAKECIKKWNILRSSFRRIRREYTPSGSAGGKKKKWVYFDALSFLDQHMHDRPTITNSPASTMTSNDSNPSSPACVTYEVEDNGDLIRIESENDLDIVEHQHKATPKRKSSGKISIKDQVDASMLDYLQNKQLHNGTSKQSPMQLFFASIALDAESLSQIDQANLKMEVLACLNRFLLKDNNSA